MILEKCQHLLSSVHLISEADLGGGGGGGRAEYNRLSKHIMNLGFDIKVIHYF